MGNNNNFNRIIEINTEVERRKMAVNAMYAMLSNSTYAKSFRVTYIAELAVSASDALIAELNKKEMTMETTDDVSYPIALALKKAGFDWPCTSFYRNLDKELWEGGEMNWNNGVDCSAPTLAVAQKWLREEKEWDVTAIPTLSELGKKMYRYYVCHWNNPEYGESTEGIFDSYEQALSAGISSALELIEKKGV